MSAVKKILDPDGLRRIVLERPVLVDAPVLALVTVALVAYALDDSAAVHHAAYLSLVVFASLSACLAARTTPPGERLVPGLIAVGTCLAAVSDIVWQTLDAMGVSPAVPVDHPPRFAGYVALCAALWVVIARTKPRHRVEATFAIDTATVVTVGALVLWSISYGREATFGDAPSYVRLVLATYPLADAMLLVLAVRVLADARTRRAIDPGLATGLLLWLAADLAYLLDPNAAGRLAMDAAWIVAPLLLSRAAWHWRPIEAPADDRRTSGSWLVGLAVAVVPLFVPPALDVVSDLRGQSHPTFFLAFGSLVLVALAFVRTARLLRAEEDALQELERARDEALAASRAKSVFVATMSHEIRTPLATVLASAEMLDDTELTEDQADLQRRMRRSGGQLHALVEDILDFSRIEAGHLELAEADLDLHALLGELAEAYRTRTAAAGLGFEVYLDPGVPRHVVGDAGRLLQVAGNLLDNALKFTERGHLTLTVRPAPGASPEGAASLEVVVADTGIGIAPDRLDAVFSAFEQVDGSTTRRFGGSGLGLAICRELVALMGGSLRVTSEPGRGSEFVATLRLRVPTNDPAVCGA